MTDQTIHLCGMLTEAIHTPFLGDRALSLENARYIMNTARHFGDEIACKPGGRSTARERRARRLRGAARTRCGDGLHARDRRARFRRRIAPPDGGRGFDGVFERAPEYCNPFEERASPQPVTRERIVKPYGDTHERRQGAAVVYLAGGVERSGRRSGATAGRRKMGFTDVSVADGRPLALGLFVLRRLRVHAASGRRRCDQSPSGAGATR